MTRLLTTALIACAIGMAGCGDPDASRGEDAGDAEADSAPEADADGEPDTDADAVDAFPDPLADFIGDATYEDCPERGDFAFSLAWEPGPGPGEGLAAGTVLEVTEDPAGTLSIAIDVSSGGLAPGSYAFTLAIPPGTGIDLSAGEAVALHVWDFTACMGCPAREVVIERGGDLVLYALDCWAYECNATGFEVGPLSFSVVDGVCPPRVWDPPGYTVVEDGGLTVSCEDGSGTVLTSSLFAGGQAPMACAGGSFLVAAGDLVRFISYVESGVCPDCPHNHREILLLRTR